MDAGGEKREVDICLHINGVQHALSVDPRFSLADVLRDRLTLRALHLGCEQGVCGACSVLIDGDPAVSCLTLAVEADGRDIRTVENFASGDRLGRIEQAFLSHGAFQCGFCTPGFLIMAHYLIANKLGTDRDAVRKQISGKVCRCTGYESIIDAIVSVANDAAEL
jgi:carbon-monoxide dehydrogenase small subunit